MKSRLNITIEEKLMEQAKRYAARNKTSVSQLVEEYFKTLNRPRGKKNILDLMKDMARPGGKVPAGNLKDLYLESRKKKYGF